MFPFHILPTVLDTVLDDDIELYNYISHDHSSFSRNNEHDEDVPISARPQRNRVSPTYFKDYHFNLIKNDFVSLMIQKSNI